MDKLEELLMELDALNKALLTKKRAGGTITPEEYALIKELVRTLHGASATVPVPEIGRLLSIYDLGLAVRYLEPNYDKLNAAFAWLENEEGSADDEDF